jgi:hypothetical protein
MRRSPRGRGGTERVLTQASENPLGTYGYYRYGWELSLAIRAASARPADGSCQRRRGNRRVPCTRRDGGRHEHNVSGRTMWHP